MKRTTSCNIGNYLYGPLQVTPAGHSYILTAVDMFSKYLVLYPIGNRDSPTVSSALFKLVCNYRICEMFISDQGTEFTAKEAAELYKLLGITQKF